MEYFIQQSCTFGLSFTPRRALRDTLRSSTTSPTSSRSAPHQEEGRLILSFSTGQRLIVPLSVRVVTPFISLSCPKHNFGICHVNRSCEGSILLSNPTDVPARWSVTHVAAVSESVVKKSTIRVKGFLQTSPAEDDPSVFLIAPNAGIVEGPTMSVASTMACVKPLVIAGADSTR